MVKNVTRFLDKSMLAKTKLGNVITSTRSKSKRNASVTDGQTFWTTDPVGLSEVEGQQQKFDKMAKTDREMCDWLQQFTRDLTLFNIDKMCVPKWKVKIAEFLRKERDNGNGIVTLHSDAKTVKLQTVIDFLKLDLRDDRAEVAMETICSIRRPAG